MRDSMGREMWGILRAWYTGVGMAGGGTGGGGTGGRLCVAWATRAGKWVSLAISQRAALLVAGGHVEKNQVKKAPTLTAALGEGLAEGGLLGRRGVGREGAGRLEAAAAEGCRQYRHVG